MNKCLKKKGAWARSRLRYVLSAASLFAVAHSSAFAQSTVTLYGIVDSAVQYGKFNDTVGPTAMAASGNLQASREFPA
jgi:general bacterial porin, GBP family